MKWECLLIALITSLSPSALAPSTGEHVIVWNVGQGQMITWVRGHVCAHFDMGGEWAPKGISALCKSKLNLVFVSHADMDHMNLIPRLKRQLPGLCLAQAPLLTTRPWQRKILTALKPCSDEVLKELPLEILKPSPDKLLSRRLNNQPPSDLLNILSLVYILNSKVLVTGDSTKEQERTWMEQIEAPQNIHTLILGHHGSDTSTSRELIFHLPSLEVAICSSRRRKYGHPHPRVLKRLRLRSLKLLITELEGDIPLKL